MVIAHSKFRRQFMVVLLIAGLLPAGLRAQGALAYFGSDSIDVAAFALTYPRFLQTSGSSDGLASRLQHLHNLMGERLLAKQGRLDHLDDDPEVRSVGYHAWRDVLADQIGRRLYLEKVSNAEAAIKTVYQQEQTSLRTRSINFPDSATALTALEALRSGVPFEALALRHSPLESILDEPWEQGWRYPDRLDPLYAAAAHDLEPGQLSAPVPAEIGFSLIQLQGKNFSPTHGHFGRVKRQEELRDLIGEQIDLDKVYSELRLWIAGQPVKWSKRRLRKIIKAQYLVAPSPLDSALAADPRLVDAALFTINKRPYSFRWLIGNLHLLPPELQLGTRELTRLQDIIRELMMVLHLLEQVQSLPDGSHWIAMADQSRSETIDSIVLQKMRRQLLQRSMPSEGTLFELWGSDSSQYYKRTEVDLQELIVADSATLATIMGDLERGASLSVLAARHTVRLWARPLKGRLGWMPTDLYRRWSPALADSLAQAIVGTVIGPVRIDGHYLYVRIWGIRYPRWTEPEQLFTRLKKRWLVEGQAPVLQAWIARRARDYYPMTVNATLLEMLAWPEEYLPPLIRDELGGAGFTGSADVP